MEMATHIISACYFPKLGEVDLTWENIKTGQRTGLTVKVTKKQDERLSEIVMACSYHKAHALNKNKSLLAEKDREIKDLNDALEQARRGISEIELDFEEDGRLVKKRWIFGKDKKHFWIEGITPGEHGEGREIHCCEQILELIVAFDKETHRLRNGLKAIRDEMREDCKPYDKYDEAQKVSRHYGKKLTALLGDGKGGS